ncbi:hypothetical protein BaRGS_00013074 [Batillaria attramentaria]|uniref:Uncharacterized protein n=1 Tax=Batillaria attramentaria TaxID=370345 RepID=A0ABD0L8Z5_9CAEN
MESDNEGTTDVTMWGNTEVQYLCQSTAHDSSTARNVPSASFKQRLCVVPLQNIPHEPVSDDVFCRHHAQLERTLCTFSLDIIQYVLSQSGQTQQLGRFSQHAMSWWSCINVKTLGEKHLYKRPDVSSNRAECGSVIFTTIRTSCQERVGVWAATQVKYSTDNRSMSGIPGK